ncbi:MAG: hypothetical protein NTV39_01640 [Candidatus Saccharibacteria bacterium]|nr:hypothetical protein [Candidatus Saccharibacteria bacterium]
MSIIIAGSIVGVAVGVGVGVAVFVVVGVGVGVCVTSPPGDGDALALGDADTPFARTWSCEISADTANKQLAASSTTTTITRILKLRNTTSPLVAFENSDAFASKSHSWPPACKGSLLSCQYFNIIILLMQK